MSAPRAGLREHVVATVMRPVVGRVLRRYLRGQARPSFDDRGFVIGSNPLRVLVIGAGLAVGYGRHDGAPSLPDQLARALSDELDRGVIVDVRAQASVRLEQTIDLIGMAGAATFDIVIWSPTLEEIFRGGSGRWTRELRGIVDHVQATGPARVHMVLMGVPAAEGDHLLQRSGTVLVEAVNRRIERVAARFDRVEFLPVPAKRIDSWETPLFEPDYQRRVVAQVAALIGLRLQRRAAAAHPATSSSEGVRIGPPPGRIPDVAGTDSTRHP